MEENLIRIYYENVRSICAKTNIKQRIETSPYEIFCFTETWLKDCDSNESFFPSDYNIYRFDRGSILSTRGGGVAILVKNTLHSRTLSISHNISCESICVLVTLKPTSLLLYVAYVPPNSEQIVYAKHFEQINELFGNYIDSNVMAIGDWNLRGITWEVNETQTSYVPVNLINHQNSKYFKMASEFLSNMQDLPSFQLSNARNCAGNVLDLVFVNPVTDAVVRTAPASVTESSQTDKFHPPIVIEMACGVFMKQENRHRFISCYRRGNYGRMSQQIESVNFAHIFHNMDINAAYDYLHEFLIQKTRDNVPVKRITAYPSKPKWWTRELQAKKNRRDKLFKRRHQNADQIEEYRTSVLEFNLLNEAIYEKYVIDVERKLKENPAEFWRFVKGNHIASYPSTMHYNELNADSPREIADLFANYFESTYAQDETEWTFDETYGTEPENAFDIRITMFDVERAIAKIKEKSCIGPDNIHPIVVKRCADVLIFPLWLLFQKSLECGLLPFKLKQFKVIPLHKKGDKSKVENYRTIAIGSVILKIFEIVVKNKLTKFVEPKLSNNQHGFRQHRSVATNLMNLSIAVHRSFEHGNKLDVFYGDFKRAFDRVCHRLLVAKLSRYGLGRRMAKWIYAFIDGLVATVRMGEISSRNYALCSGVPAGSVLGPVLFLMFIDDIDGSIEHCGTSMFADDIKIWKEIAAQGDSDSMQSDLDSLLAWCNVNRLFFNHEKCYTLTICRSRLANRNDYYLGSHLVERRTEIRDLGVLIDQRFTFISHIEHVIASARQSIGCVKSVSRGKFSIETMKMLYAAYARSKLEFAAIIWDPYQRVYKDDIESVQKSFLLYLLGDSLRRPPYRLAPYKDRCKRVGLQPLAERRQNIDLCMSFDILNDTKFDLNIKNCFVPFNSSRDLRVNRLFIEPRYCNEYSFHQPIARLIRLVNSNCDIFKDVHTRKSFKQKIRNQRPTM